MIDWFNTLAASRALAAENASILQEQGFVAIPGPVASVGMDELSRAYYATEASATGDDIKIGSTTTRVRDFVNRGPEVDDLYVFPPLLDACCRVIAQPFKLSSLHSRTLRPAMPNQNLHVDVRRESSDWPLLGFIFMVDEFRPDNGATRFIPGSHLWPAVPEDSMSDLQADVPGQVLACGSAGSLLIFHGSTCTVTQRTSPASLAAHFRARLSQGTDRRRRTGALECSPRLGRDSHQWRAMFSICEREFVIANRQLVP
jgi:hypothetical protein